MIDKELFALLGSDKKYIKHITILNSIGLLANITITACICVCLYMAVQGRFKVSEYVLFIGISLAMVVIKFWCSIFVGKFRSILGNNVKKSLREKTYAKLLALGINGSKEKSASLTQMSIEGIEQLDLYYSSYLPQVFCAIVAPILLFIICVILEWKTAFVLLACLPIIPVSIIIVSKYARKVFGKYWDKYTSMGDSFLDNIQGMKDLKVFNADATKQIETNVQADEFRKITMKVLVMQLASITIMDLVAFGGAGLAIVMALRSGQSEQISPFIALFLVLISAEFFLSIRALGGTFHVAMNGATAGKKILAFLDLPEPKWGDGAFDTSASAITIEEISLKNLSFSYDADRYVLNDINITLHKGFNAIVGESGSGKSTIVSLILGSYSPQKGLVSINNNGVRTLNRKAYYARIALISYNTFIFNASIRDNFLLAKADVSDEEIFRALKLVNLDSFVAEVCGLDYVILEDSENISGGQRQRLSLAINLVKERDVYIFDEATSNIDIESELLIMNTIQELAKTKIVLLISHRLQNVVNSDVIYVLQEGNLVEKGTHSELLTIAGVYNKVYQKQYELENGYKDGYNA